MFISDNVLIWPFSLNPKRKTNIETFRALKIKIYIETPEYQYSETLIHTRVLANGNSVPFAL